MEESTKGIIVNIHLHGYLLWTDGIGFRTDDVTELSFQDVHPRVDQCISGTSNARSPRKAALHGLWYVSVMKLGTLQSATNYEACRDYVPSREWLISLFDSRKLTMEQFFTLSMAFGTGHSHRRRDAKEIEIDLYDRIVDDHIAKETAAISEDAPFVQPQTCPAII